MHIKFSLLLLRVFFWGMLISFLGTLPMGTLNIMGMQIGIQESVRQALFFVAGALLVEMIYVRISLVAISWVRRQRKLMKIMEWLTLGIVLALAIGSFAAALRENPEAKNALLHNDMHRFLFGMMMSAINPVQIPFWFGWSTVLFSKGVLKPSNRLYNIYIVGIGLGTLLGNCIFIFGGRWLVSVIHNSEMYMNWVIGGIFTLTAIIHLIKMLRHKDAVEQIEQIEEKDIPPPPED